MKAPFFITGEQRSGTTLLSVVLDKHSEVHIDSNSVGFRLVSCFNHYGRVLPFNLHHSRSMIQSWLIENDYKGRLAELIDYEHFTKFPDARQAILDGIKRRLDKQEKQLFGDKSPGLHMYIPDLLRIIPEAKILHIVRDGRAVAWSKNNRARRNLKLAAHDWLQGNIAGLTNQALIGEKAYKIIRYEDLVEEPEPVIRDICSFLDIAFEPAMIADDVPSDEADAYVKKGFDQSKIDSFKTHLKPGKIRQIEKIQGPLLKRFGYDLVHPLDKPYKEMPVFQHVMLTQWELFVKLFISTQEGMTDRKTRQVSIPFSTRVKHFIYWSGFNLLPDKMFRRYFRGRHIKKLYID